jgi:hypothetical protein
VALGALVLMLYALFRYVPLPGVPCEVSPAKTCATPDDAIALVPAAADAYLHIDLDPDSSQGSAAAEVAGRLPHAGQIRRGLLGLLGPPPGLELGGDAGDWIGDEAAVALLAGGGTLSLLEIGDAEGARRFAAGLGPGEPSPPRAGGGLRAFSNGIAYAELDGFLAVGPSAAVRAAIETQRRARSLEDSAPAGRVRDALPDQRVADAYLSPEGAARLLAGRTGLASQLDVLVDFGATEGLGAALVAHRDGFELRLVSVLGPAGGEPPGRSFFAAFPRFEPRLAAELSPRTLLYVGIADPARTVRALLRQAAQGVPELVTAFQRFAAELRRGGVDVEGDVLPVLSGEAAVAAAEGPSGPYLTFVFGGVDEERARETMARLQGPLVAALAPARTGQAPGFDAERLDGVVMRRLRLSAALDLAYAVFDGKLVVATNPAGVRQAVEGTDSLAGTDAYKAATGAAPAGASALVFLNLEGLVRRAGPLGLDQIVRGFAEDVSKLRALAVNVRSDENSLQTTLFLDIE